MATRRTFLTVNLAGAAEWALGAPLSTAAARPGLPAANSTASSPRDYWNDWPEYLIRKMNQARAVRLAELARLTTAAQVDERAANIRSRIWELVGGPLQKTPLNAQVVGKIDRGSYRIEKVIFESLPQVYVTANLYVPNTGPGPFPAVLVPLGHAANGKAYRSYQYLYQNLARKGYVVLPYDPYGQGERFQYLDPKTGRSRYRPTGEHSKAGTPMLLLGDTFALYRAWDGIRALDYLLSRPEVDAARVGCTGHSGGATMAMYLVALEPRLSAAVVVEGQTEDMAGPAFEPPGAVADAEQNIVGGLPFGIDRGDLLAAFTPKPLLICYTTHDVGQTYSPTYEDSTLEIVHHLKQGYGVCGAGEKVALFASHLPHDLDFFNRRATYEWFNRWLGNSQAGVDEAEFESSPEGSLNCTTTGQVLTSLGGRSVVQVNTDRTGQVLPASPFASANGDVAQIRQKVRSDLAGLLALPRDRTPLRPEVLSSVERRNLLVEEFQIESEPGVRITGWFARPTQNHAPCPTVLYLTERGGNEVVAEPSSMERAFASGHAVCALTLRGLGITAPRFPRSGPGFNDDNLADAFAWTCLALGQAVIAQRVWDVIRGIDYLAGRADVAPSQIRVLGVGSLGLAAEMALALDDRPRSLLLERTVVSYAAIMESEDYSLPLGWFLPAILRHFDLPDLAAALGPRPCWILNAVDANGSVLAQSSLREHYARRTAFDSPAFSHLKCFTVADHDVEDIRMQWLENS
jgi:cephalosporin-C deacetylase-like acetyl esterase